MTDQERAGGIDIMFEGSVATLRLSNPPLNLLTTDLFQSLRVRLSEISEMSDVRVLIVAGKEGGPFSAGSDMSEFGEIRRDAAGRKILIENLSLMDLEEFPVPTIAAIEHYALGGGLELALACDLRVVASSARLGLPEARIGGLASNGAQRLTSLIGPGRTSQMLFLAEELDGREAESIGLANWAVQPGETHPFALDLARRIAGLGPLSVRKAKELVRDSVRGARRDSFVQAVRAQEVIFDSEELAIGVRAFFEKTVPDFSTDRIQDSQGNEAP